MAGVLRALRADFGRAYFVTGKRADGGDGVLRAAEPLQLAREHVHRLSSRPPSQVSCRMRSTTTAASLQTPQSASGVRVGRWGQGPCSTGMLCALGICAHACEHVHEAVRGCEQV